jgi:hypothetical protein
MSLSITDRLKTEEGLRDHLRYIFHDHGFSTEPVITRLQDGRLRATCVFVVHNPVPVDCLDIAPRQEKKAKLLEQLDGFIPDSYEITQLSLVHLRAAAIRPGLHFYAMWRNNEVVIPRWCIRLESKN